MTSLAYAIRQTDFAYSSNRGEYVKDKQVKTHCISVFKDSASMSTTLNGLWAEVINHLEQTNYSSATEPSIINEYNGQVQNRSYRSKYGEAVCK